MDGDALLYRLRQALNEYSDSSFLDTRTSYDYLWRAAIELVNRTACLHSTQAITSVASQRTYDLNGDFLRLYLKNSDNKRYVVWSSGSNTHFPTEKDYEDIISANNTTSILIPTGLAILDKSTLPTRLTGTATSIGTTSNGECTLTDSAGSFSSVEAGDIVNNTTDSSSGVVLSRTSSTVLVTALFGGTNNQWAVGNAYVIQPQGRLSIIFDPPPSTAGHTITVHYVQRPTPVYSSYGAYRFQPQYADALVYYASFLYRHRGREFNYADAHYKLWEMAVSRGASGLNESFNRRGFKMNLKGRK